VSGPAFSYPHPDPDTGKSCRRGLEGCDRERRSTLAASRPRSPGERNQRPTNVIDWDAVCGRKRKRPTSVQARASSLVRCTARPSPSRASSPCDHPRSIRAATARSASSLILTPSALGAPPKTFPEGWGELVRYVCSLTWTLSYPPPAFRKRSGSPSPSSETGNLVTGQRPPNDVGANLDNNEERASLVAVGKYAVYREEPLEARREVTPDPHRKVSAFNGWQAHVVLRAIPHLQMNRKASKMALPAANVAYRDRRPSAKNINRGSDLLGRAARQRRSRILRRNAELPGPRLGSRA
jgi:hypothetical protein